MSNENTDMKSLYFFNVNNYFTKYLPSTKDGSAHTISSYKNGLKHFGQYITDEAGFRLNQFHYTDVTYDIMLDFRNYMHDTLNLAVSSCNLYLAANKSYINYCAARDISLQPVAFAVSQVPGFSLPVEYQSIITDETGLSALLNAPPNNCKGIRDKAILCMLYDGALRAGELVSLLYGDISIDENTALVIHGKGHKERTVYLGAELEPLLKQYRTLYHSNPDPLRPFFYANVCNIVKPMTTRNLELLVNTYANRARKELTDQYGEEKAARMLPLKITPHTLRRTRATLLLRDGVPIEQISVFLGHANTEVTRKHYAALSEQQKIELARKAVPVSNEGGTGMNDDTSQRKLWENDIDDLDKLFDF